MSKSIFLKNWRKKRLLKQIYKLREESALQCKSAEVAKRSADEKSRFITLLQEQASSNDVFSSIHLSCYLDDYLAQLHSYENDYAILNQRYLNTQDQLKRLEEVLESL